MGKDLYVYDVSYSTGSMSTSFKVVSTDVATATRGAESWLGETFKGAETEILSVTKGPKIEKVYTTL